MEGRKYGGKKERREEEREKEGGRAGEKEEGRKEGRKQLRKEAVLRGGGMLLCIWALCSKQGCLRLFFSVFFCPVSVVSIPFGVALIHRAPRHFQGYSMKPEPNLWTGRPCFYDLVGTWAHKGCLPIDFFPPTALSQGHSMISFLKAFQVFGLHSKMLKPRY